MIKELTPKDSHPLREEPEESDESPEQPVQSTPPEPSYADSREHVEIDIADGALVRFSMASMCHTAKEIKDFFFEIKERCNGSNSKPKPTYT